MLAFETITDARNAIMDFRANHGAELPDDMVEEFRNLSASPSPVDQVVKLGEMLYARREDCCPEASELAAALTSYATVNGWHGLAEDGRGEKMVQAIRRDLKQEPPLDYKWPDVESDPPPLERFVKLPEADLELEAEPERKDNA
jgi:hypothetical protein